ncbi:MAG: 3D domain-containing protein [Verrucomicrobiota bacterium]
MLSLFSVAVSVGLSLSGSVLESLEAEDPFAQEIPVDSGPVDPGPVDPGPVSLEVRTTAYTHTESDHLRYKNKTASGTILKYGKVRSAAADWSVFPLGTKFRIKGEPAVYQVDDYGSALVGTKTIDLYMPNRSMMNRWGVRHVEIELIEEGCLAKSLKILKPRSRYGAFIRRMVRSIEAQT